MRVVSLADLGKDINRYRFFFIFLFWSRIFKKSSKFWASKYKNASYFLILRQTAIIESFLPIDWRTFIWWKNQPKCCTIWFGMWDARILQIFYSRAVVHRTIVDSPAFLDTSLAEKIAVCVHLTRLVCRRSIGGFEVFLNKRLRTLNFFQIFKIKIQKYKTYKGWCTFQGLSIGISLRLIKFGRIVPLTHFLIPFKMISSLHFTRQ